MKKKIKEKRRKKRKNEEKSIDIEKSNLWECFGPLQVKKTGFWVEIVKCGNFFVLKV